MQQRKTTKKCLVAIYAFFALLTVWGNLRLTSSTEGFVEGVTLRIVQANISQHHKWDPKLQFDGLRKHVELTESPGLEKVTHVIWPETAVPYVIKDGTTLTQRLGDMLESNQYLITGGLHSEGERLWNSIDVINGKGEIVGKYDKHKLVPFGEFLPLRWLIPDSLETPAGMKDFDSGEGVQTLEWPGLPKVSPLICYEAIFPELAVAKDRPQFLLNLTNDAWFGMSSGPYQHFHMARLRSVEQGLPLVRVANTGISAVIDSYGRVREMLPLGTAGIINAGLPLPLPEQGFYAKYPGLMPILLLLLTWPLWLVVKKFTKN